MCYCSCNDFYSYAFRSWCDNASSIDNWTIRLGLSSLLDEACLRASKVSQHLTLFNHNSNRFSLCSITVMLIPIITLITYLPCVFRGEIVKCVTDGSIIYHKRDNAEFLQTVFYSVNWICILNKYHFKTWTFFMFSNTKMLNFTNNSNAGNFLEQVYKVILEIVFKLAPTFLIAGLNIRIMIVYRRTCDKRRRMTISHTKEDDTRKFAEERRLMLLLGEQFITIFIIIKSKNTMRLFNRRKIKIMRNVIVELQWISIFSNWIRFSWML